MVPGAGVEPARHRWRGILSPVRLPIPPPGPHRNAIMANSPASGQANVRHKAVFRPVHGLGALQICRTAYRVRWPYHRKAMQT